MHSHPTLIATPLQRHSDARAAAHSANALPTPPWQPCALPAAVPVQPLKVPAHCTVVLECTQGRLWLTQADHPGDFFMEPGQRRYFPGPAQLYLGAQGHGDASVRWMLLHRGEHATA